jgi:hypothetical protein
MRTNVLSAPDAGELDDLPSYAEGPPAHARWDSLIYDALPTFVGLATTLAITKEQVAELFDARAAELCPRARDPRARLRAEVAAALSRLVDVGAIRHTAQSPRRYYRP